MNTRNHDSRTTGDEKHAAHGVDNPAAEAGMSRDVINIGLHIFRDRPKARAIWYAAVWAVYLGISSVPSLITDFKPIRLEVTLVHVFDFAAAYLLMTVFYNGKKGRYPKFSKWFFYIFYPAHIVLAIILRAILL